MFTFIRSGDTLWLANFWCWGRKDYSEKNLRQLPIILNFREEVFTSFSTSFLYNKTSRRIQCNSSEEWAKNWFDVSDQSNPPNDVPCSTTVSPVAAFDWNPYSEKL